MEDPRLAPVAELSAAMQMWERGQFAQAATIFERFTRLNPPPEWKWIGKLQPLARDRLSDYQLFAEWQKTRAATRDPEAALTNLKEVERRLKAKGALTFQLADEEAKLAAQAAEAMETRSAEEKKIAAEEAPRWTHAVAAARQASTAYQFEKALAILQSTKLRAASLQPDRERELQRAGWLAEWKSKLIRDLNETGYGGVVTDVHGVRYEGPVHRATLEKIELKTRYGSVLTDWLNLSPQMLLQMSSAFIRARVADNAERQWLSAIFAQQTGQTQAAQELAEKAAVAKPEFRDLRARFFLAEKK